MGSFGVVRFSAVVKMLNACMPGVVIEKKLHHVWVTYAGKTYRGFPKGAHGSKNSEIQIGHVRQLLRYFEVRVEDASQYLPILGKQKKKSEPENVVPIRKASGNRD